MCGKFLGTNVLKLNDAKNRKRKCCRFLLQILRKPAVFSFAVLCIIMCLISLSSEAEFSTVLSVNAACLRLSVVRNMPISSNFNETTQFLEAFYKAFARNPSPIFKWCARRVFGHVLSKKRTRLNSCRISNSQFVIMRWNPICWECGETLSKNLFSCSKKHHDKWIKVNFELGNEMWKVNWSTCLERGAKTAIEPMTSQTPTLSAELPELIDSTCLNCFLSCNEDIFKFITWTSLMH